MDFRRVLLCPLLSLLALPPAAPQTTTPLAASAQTAVPPLIPYSGSVSTADGKAITADVVGVTFQIYKEENGGEPLWSESQTVFVDPTGHYRVQLGATTPNGLPMNLFSTGEARWLEVQIAGHGPTQRVLLTSVPYALKAGDAATLGGLPVSAFALAGAKPPSKIAPATPGPVTLDVTSNITASGGTPGYLPVFTGASTLADSILFENTFGVGIGDIPNGMLDVNGKSIFRGPLQVARIGNATSSAGVSSNPFDFYAQVYDSSARANIGPWFQLQAEPTGNNTGTPGATLNLLYDDGKATSASETGLYINPNGTLHFATGQTFPGSISTTGV
jgi:hypothetical protein